MIRNPGAVTHQNDGSQHLKYHVHLKIEKVLEVESQLWEVTRKSTVDKGKIVM